MFGQPSWSGHLLSFPTRQFTSQNISSRFHCLGQAWINTRNNIQIQQKKNTFGKKHVLTVSLDLRVKYRNVSSSTSSCGGLLNRNLWVMRALHYTPDHYPKLLDNYTQGWSLCCSAHWLGGLQTGKKQLLTKFQKKKEKKQFSKVFFL